MTPVLLCALLLGADVEDERADIQERLEQERAAFEALGTEKKNLLTVLDTLERLARESTARAAAFDKAVKRIDAQLVKLKKENESAQNELREQQARMGPRLVALYRLRKRDSLSFVLSAASFSSLIKRQRALSTLVETDVTELEQLAMLARYHRMTTRRLERVEGALKGYTIALRSEQAVGRARLARFQEVMSSIQAEQSRMSRVINELEASERELTAMVSEMRSPAELSGFRARKGKMPLPAPGLVEVGFGKVVNPKFNTVTVQKGIDIRGSEGTKVVSVATGSVVFAGWLKGYGNLVIIDHGDQYHSLYAHLAEAQVEVGNEVEEGEEIGTIGDTGSLKGTYLYFEIRKQGQAIDPQPWLSTEPDE